MKRLALRSALSARASESAVLVVDDIDWSTPKTKQASGLLEAIDASGKTLLVISQLDSVAGKSFRNQIYDQYKANRPPAPEDLVPQFPLTRDATRAFNISCVEKEGFEADDIIATYARQAREAGGRVTIISSDKGLMQLVGGGVEIGEHAIIGAGAVVLDEVPAYYVAAGVPAKLVRDRRQTTQS